MKNRSTLKARYEKMRAQTHKLSDFKWNVAAQGSCLSLFMCVDIVFASVFFFFYRWLGIVDKINVLVFDNWDDSLIVAPCHACTGVQRSDPWTEALFAQTEKPFDRMVNRSMRQNEKRIIQSHLLTTYFFCRSLKLWPIDWQKWWWQSQRFNYKHMVSSHTGMPTHHSQRMYDNNFVRFFPWNLKKS